MPDCLSLEIKKDEKLNQRDTSHLRDDYSTKRTLFTILSNFYPLSEETNYSEYGSILLAPSKTYFTRISGTYENVETGIHKVTICMDLLETPMELTIPKPVEVLPEIYFGIGKICSGPFEIKFN